uniref:Uncharacterized protein n=1 Tax=Oryza rufipogon TaxID=4529 RepID=A0A0E0P803_ORYRU
MGAAGLAADANAFREFFNWVTPHVLAAVSAATASGFSRDRISISISWRKKNSYTASDSG